MAHDPCTEGLGVYLVGGAVRDELLGRPVQERDWVVVGATPDAMEQRGFRPVGQDFPVFLHPHTHEEYALARTERKTGHGYHGFTVHAAPDVTLEEDLERRDLTINAMARTPDGGLIDPFRGQADLAARRLRHVSPAFREDPVRILRLARFAARFAPLDFTPATETMALCREMVTEGEVDHLVPERVWQELARALTEPRPSAFIRVLRDTGALARLIPELERLFDTPERRDHHPEGDAGRHTLLALDMAARMGLDGAVRFAVLMHDLGKGTTPQEFLPGHPGHERRGVPLVREVCRRLRTPNHQRDLALTTTRFHMLAHRSLHLRTGTLLRLLEDADAFRRPERFAAFLEACEADARGREGQEERDYPQRAFLNACLEATAEVRGGTFAAQGLQGPAIAEAVREERLRRLAALPHPTVTADR